MDVFSEQEEGNPTSYIHIGLARIVHNFNNGLYNAEINNYYSNDSSRTLGNIAKSTSDGEHSVLSYFILLCLLYSPPTNATPGPK